MSPSIPRIAAFLLLAAFAARAGALLVSTNQSLTEKKPALTYKVSIDKDRVRIDEPSGRLFIYRQDKGLFWIVDTPEKSYMEMNKADVEKFAKQMEATLTKLQEQLKNMPPEQRKMMEAMTQKMLPGKGPKVSYKKVASGEKVNGWAADKYEGSLEGAKRNETWTADPKKMGMNDADYKVIKEMGEFFQGLVKNMENMYGADFAAASGLQGIPVRIISYQDGKAQTQTDVKEVKQETFAATHFEVPAGLAKKSMELPGMSP